MSLPMPDTIRTIVDSSNHTVADDDLVNFGSQDRPEINPTTGPRSYWFRFGDIAYMTLPQIQAAIGDLAAAGTPGSVAAMRVSNLPQEHFDQRPGSAFFGLDEYTIDVPVRVKYSIDVC